ncbi:MAG: hypothetical protein ACRC0L_12970 [Angustibacter sp.]
MDTSSLPTWSASSDDPDPGPSPTPPTSPTPPANIMLAQKLMYLGAVLSVAGAVATILLTDTMRTAMQEAAPSLSEADVNSALQFTQLFGVAASGVLLILWLVNAHYIGLGRRWARIFSTVLGVLNFFAYLYGLVNEKPLATVIINTLNFILGTTVLFLLWRESSNRFFNEQV